MKEIFRKPPVKTERRKYVMTPDEFQVLKTASNPGRIVQLNAPKALSAEERAAIFWNRMSDKYRFDVATVAPDLEGHPGCFTAVPLPEPTEGDGHGAQ